VPVLLIPRSPAHILSTEGCNAVYSRKAKSRIRYGDMLPSPCLRAACLRQEMIRTSRVAGIWFCWRSGRKRRDLSYRQWYSSLLSSIMADVTACAISSGRCVVVVVEWYAGSSSASPPPVAYVVVKVALSDCDGGVTHSFTHTAPKKKAESRARS
jgi:hypothetical protein